MPISTIAFLAAVVAALAIIAVSLALPQQRCQPNKAISSVGQRKRRPF